MVDSSVYRQQAEENEKAARKVQLEHPDWAVTMCFYAALHWINDYAFCQGVDIDKEFSTSKSTKESSRKEESSHVLRWRYVQRISYEKRAKQLRHAYSKLWSESKRARYLEGIKTLGCNARDYYLQNETDVKRMFAYLSTLKRILSEAT